MGPNLTRPRSPLQMPVGNGIRSNSKMDLTQDMEVVEPEPEPCEFDTEIVDQGSSKLRVLERDLQLLWCLDCGEKFVNTRRKNPIPYLKYFMAYMRGHGDHDFLGPCAVCNYWFYGNAPVPTVDGINLTLSIDPTFHIHTLASALRIIEFHFHALSHDTSPALSTLKYARVSIKTPDLPGNEIRKEDLEYLVLMLRELEGMLPLRPRLARLEIVGLEGHGELGRRWKKERRRRSRRAIREIEGWQGALERKRGQCKGVEKAVRWLETKRNCENVV
ncbi:hypothetical protein BJ875DRAFT_525472 [Amylocarpus encephaloides]|uniref:Uncharacterized protein n=1 Tax=Amylocarpus encephaloides TaxID=45428 RepID=A0A9P8C144_9HELO|nr:hypothetical protein BJ875DRAFT_525472 [Amylocarpus encephaloides]